VAAKPAPYRTARQAIGPGDPAWKVRTGDRCCRICGCPQSNDHPFVHFPRCGTIKSRPSVNPRIAAEMFRAMWPEEATPSTK